MFLDPIEEWDKIVTDVENGFSAQHHGRGDLSRQIELRSIPLQQLHDYGAGPIDHKKHLFRWPPNVWNR